MEALDHDCLYKESDYNIVIKQVEGKSLIFNTMTSALALFDNESLAKFRWRSDIDNPSELQGEIANGFVVPVSRNERDEYLARCYQYAHEDTSKLHVVMVPSLACNYRCKYCFEGSVLSNSKCIDDDKVEQSINFIKNYLIDNDCKYLTIEWFGGEPLLQLSVINRVAPELISFCEDHCIEYHSHMITNGRLLTKDVALDLFYKCRVTMFQITIDGLPNNYAKMKGCQQGDFLSVVTNIFSLNDTGIKINLRINVSKDTKDEIKELLRCLYFDMDIHAGFYLADVRNYADNDYAVSDFYSVKHELVEWIKTYPEILRWYDIKLPKIRFSSCKATSREMLCIDYKGKLFQCAHMIDRFESSGSIFDGIDSNSSSRIAALDNKLPEKCMDCKWLPTCLGNCYADRALEDVKMDCDAYTADLEYSVKLWYDIKNNIRRS